MPGWQRDERRKQAAEGSLGSPERRTKDENGTSTTGTLFVSRLSGAIVLEPKREPTVVDARYRLGAYATLRRGDLEVGTRRRLQDDYNTP
jgi:hypothetical protein